MDALVVGFDLDMTLVDSRPGILATMSALETDAGIGLGDPSVLLDELLRRNLDLVFADRFSPGEATALADRFRTLYVDHGVPGTHLLPGACEAVDAVRSAGGRTIVVTAKYEPNAVRCLDQVGIEVDEVFGWRYADGKATTLAEAGAALYLGDTPNDVRAAIGAGAEMVAVTTGPHDEHELRAVGADTVLASLTEFPPWFAGWLSARA